jgi:hypothetical protein
MYTFYRSKLIVLHAEYLPSRYISFKLNLNRMCGFFMYLVYFFTYIYTALLPLQILSTTQTLFDLIDMRFFILLLYSSIITYQK